MTTDRGRAALRELDLLMGHLMVTVMACVETRVLDVGELVEMASRLQQFTIEARAELSEEPGPSVPAT